VVVKTANNNNETHQHVKEDNNIPKNAGKYYFPIEVAYENAQRHLPTLSVTAIINT
jgi:hypothetical protein